MIILKILLTLGFLVALLGFLRTWQLENRDAQQVFLRGKVPSKPLEGFYKGRLGEGEGWQGKEFDPKESRGINIFLKDGERTKKYPFKVYEANGLRDKNLKVIRIDYDLPENPFYIRIIKDEIVEVEKDKFLGKAHLNLIPTFPITAVFFNLSK